MDRLTIVLAVLMMSLCAAAWSVIGKRFLAGQPILPLADRRPVPWKGADLLPIAIYVCALLYSALRGGRQAETVEEFVLAMMASVVVNLVLCGCTVFWICMRAKVRPDDFGWRSDLVLADIRLGLIAFASVAVPIYGLQAFLSQFVAEQHPIIENLRQHPSPLLFGLAGLSAVVAAPIAEEFIFRVLLQGWLESVRLPHMLVNSEERTKRLREDDEGRAANPYASPRSESSAAADERPRPSAIVITSMLFAAMHIGHGAAPVPLFFLSLALGYLYQRTHRLLPCVTLHFCINACSFAVLCLGN
jgi:membrane protease YdiL (CAAX protease family)